MSRPRWDNQFAETAAEKQQRLRAARERHQMKERQAMEFLEQDEMAVKGPQAVQAEMMAFRAKLTRIASIEVDWLTGLLNGNEAMAAVSEELKR